MVIFLPPLVYDVSREDAERLHAFFEHARVVDSYVSAAHEADEWV